jgi:hypothetical protein
VLRGAALAGAALGAQHERDGQLAAGHEVRLRRLVDELVEGEGQEVDEHDLDDGAEAGLGGADRDPADRRLADRRVADTLRPELLREPPGGAERPALGDVLAEHEHALVGAHGLGQCRRDCAEVGGLVFRSGGGRATASAMSLRRAYGSGGIDELSRQLGRGKRARAGEFERLFDLGARLLLEAFRAELPLQP